jgi:hypothetical protein
LNKPERKLIKLQSKAQECVSREKAVKIIKKSDKWSQKITKMSEAKYLLRMRINYPHRGVAKRIIARKWLSFPLASLARQHRRDNDYHFHTSEHEVRAGYTAL